MTSIKEIRLYRTIAASKLDSAWKVKLGRAWKRLARPQYRYYMVFQDQAMAADGAYPLDRFLEIARGL